MAPIGQFVAAKPPPQQPPGDRCGKRLAEVVDRELLGAAFRVVAGQRTVHGLGDVPAFPEGAQPADPQLSVEVGARLPGARSAIFVLSKLRSTALRPSHLPNPQRSHSQISGNAPAPKFNIGRDIPGAGRRMDDFRED
jgi:hypothetical protein